MMLAAARAVADFVRPQQIEEGQIYPEAKDLRACAATVRALLTLLFFPAPLSSQPSVWVRLDCCSRLTLLYCVA